MRLLVILAALLVAASAAAQEPQAKVWTNADLGTPAAAASRPKLDPAVLEGFRQRAEAIPFGTGGFAGYGLPDEAPAAAPGLEGHGAGLPLWGGYVGWTGPYPVAGLPVWQGRVNGRPTTVFRVGSGPRGSAPRSSGSRRR